MKVDVIIPAFNEQNSIGSVINDIPKELVRDIVVVDNNSSDETSINAQNAGATVLKQPIQGYGNACLKGIEYVTHKETQPDVVVFLDADYSDFPQEMNLLLNKIWNGADMVIGNRVKEKREKGLTWHPVAVKKEGFTFGDRAFVILEKTNQFNEPHRFKSGTPVELFSTADSKTNDSKDRRINGIIQYLKRDQMKVVLNPLFGFRFGF